MIARRLMPVLVVLAALVLAWARGGSRLTNQAAVQTLPPEFAFWIGPPPPPPFGLDKSPNKADAPANQASAVASLKTINSACIKYSSTYHIGFPQFLLDLGPSFPAKLEASELGAGLIDMWLANGRKSGYDFRYRPGSPDSSGRINGYTVVARPVFYGLSGQYNYFTDQSGVIRSTSKDQEATASDEALAP